VILFATYVCPIYHTTLNMFRFLAVFNIERNVKTGQCSAKLRTSKEIDSNRLLICSTHIVYAMHVFTSVKLSNTHVLTSIPKLCWLPSANLTRHKISFGRLLFLNIFPSLFQSQINRNYRFIMRAYCT